MNFRFFSVFLILIFCSCYPINTYYPVLSKTVPHTRIEKSKFIYSEGGLSIFLRGEYYSPLYTSIIADFKLEVLNSSYDTIKIEKEDIQAEYEDRNIGTEIHFNSSYTKPDSGLVLIVNPKSKLKRWLIFKIPSENVRFYDRNPYLKVLLKVKRTKGSEIEEVPLKVDFVSEKRE